ncbi:hypothetical protein AB0G00_10200 [Nocardia salmonicida]|uniref:hypothetical protein n=1 Tax=Nocardia salmonicida TaxID=53431 RepID=UPI0033C60451
MAIVNGRTPRIPVAARSTTRHDTIEPAPDDGSHSRLPEIQDEQPTVTAANSVEQQVHRRIINTSSTCRMSLSPAVSLSTKSGGCIGPPGMVLTVTSASSEHGVTGTVDIPVFRKSGYF